MTAFQDSIDDYLEFCESRGENPEKPYSGHYPLRMLPALHRAAAIRALRENKSLNQLIVGALEMALGVPTAAIPEGDRAGMPIALHWQQEQSPESPAVFTVGMLQLSHSVDC
jgi:hypothetical protein